MQHSYADQRSTFRTMPVRRIEGVERAMARMPASRRVAMGSDQRGFMRTVLYGKPSFNMMASGIESRYNTGHRTMCWLRKYRSEGRTWDFVVKASPSGVEVEVRTPALPIPWARHRPLKRAAIGFVRDLARSLPAPRGADRTD